MIQRNYGESYTKSYIDPMALLCPIVNPQSLVHRFATFFTHKSFSSSGSCNMVHPPFDPPKITIFTQVSQDEV